MKKKLTLSKKELIKLWKKECDNASANTVLEKSGPVDGQMYSIKLNDILSISLFSSEIKIVFNGQIEYLSEKVSEKENEELVVAFFEAEETAERLVRDKITSSGIKALWMFLDK